MSYDQIIQLIRDVGFPIFVSGYLLFRLETTMNQLKDSLQAHSVMIEKLVTKLDKEPSK
jgi:hypothetical protein